MGDQKETINLTKDSEAKNRGEYSTQVPVAAAIKIDDSDRLTV